jgi:hypothetical protein
MAEYAISEVYELLQRLDAEDEKEAIARYLCALFAELAYYHVPQWEIDLGQKRAKVIPSSAYRTLVARGRATNLATVSFEGDVPGVFVIEERSAIAVGMRVNDYLFIGFRGTLFWSDWRINARSTPLLLPSPWWRGVGGRFHKGFTEEALRIVVRINDHLRSSRMQDVKHAFVSGHSLGGAIAAISNLALDVGPRSARVFGTPRYADASGYWLSQPFLPTHIRRTGDLVPTVPPRWMGYADHPNEFQTSGAPYVDPARTSVVSGSREWVRFVSGRFSRHSIEEYRGEVGEAASAHGARLHLTDFARL